MKLEDFKEVWFCDFEYYFDPDLLPVPICFCARELRTGEEVRVWLEEGCHPRVPLDVGKDSLYVCFQATAEMGAHLALGWAIPSNILDLRIEYLNITNGKRGKEDPTDLVSILDIFSIGHMFELEKKELQKRIIQGPPFSEEEREVILEYCAQDGYVLEKLLLKMISRINLSQALFRGRYMYSLAVVEKNGIPFDMPLWVDMKENWEELKLRLIQELDKQYGIHEGTKFKHDRFGAYLKREGLVDVWKRTKKAGKLSTAEDFLKEMALIYPQLNNLYQLKLITGKMKDLKLGVGADGRHRAYLNPFGTVTGRNAPQKFIFGGAKWLRGLIKPSPGWCIISADYSSQEFAIAAYKSNDRNKISNYLHGDPYLRLAKNAGAIPSDGTKKSHPEVRSVYKIASLGFLYGLTEHGLARKLKGDKKKAKKLLRDHKKEYRTFWNWIDNYCSLAVFRGVTETKLGWRRLIPPGANPRSIRNHPMQSLGADMCLLVITLLVEEGIEIIAPLHDGFYVHCPVSEAEKTAERVREIMIEASRLVLGGDEIRVDVEMFNDRYMDEDGKEMWDLVISELEAIKQKKTSSQQEVKK